MNDSLNESLDSKLKIAGGEQNVSPDVFMHAGVHLKECLNIFSVNPTLLTASVVDVGHIMVTQEGSEVLRVPDICLRSRPVDPDVVCPFVRSNVEKNEKPE